MKRLLELLSDEEKSVHDRSLDVSAAPTQRVRDKTEAVRRFLAEHCYWNEEAEAMWAQAPPNARRKVLVELLWRAGCILDKSSTAVIGLTRFDLGFGFKLSHTELRGGEDAFVILVPK